MYKIYPRMFGIEPKNITFADKSIIFIQSVMKRTLFLICAIISLASCSVNKSMVKNQEVSTDIKAFTVANLNVANQAISHTYLPTRTEGKTLSQDQLVKNAIFEALERNGYDTMVQVRYHVKVMRGLFGRRITQIDINGFPANYTKFRAPNDEDRKNAATF